MDNLKIKQEEWETWAELIAQEVQWEPLAVSDLPSDRWKDFPGADYFGTTDHWRVVCALNDRAKAVNEGRCCMIPSDHPSCVRRRQDIDRRYAETIALSEALDKALGSGDLGIKE